MADPVNIEQILQQNKGKQFVDRILNRDKYPTLDLGGGNYATHKMSWVDVNGKYHVFPTVVLQQGKLVELDPRTAYEYSRLLNDYLEFDTPEQADFFSKNYKRVWNK